MVAPTYAEVHRYDGAVLEHAQRDQLTPCSIRFRDIEIIRDVWRYKFLTAPQLTELWWPGGAQWPAQRRLLQLFRAGYLDRFRPRADRGSYPWTYHLGAEGHRLLRHAGYIPDDHRYRPRTIYDYGYVLHEIQLNAWVLALRRILGDKLVAWDGERDINPSLRARQNSLAPAGEPTPADLREPQPRLLRPDAVLIIQTGETKRTLLIEYDRTRRLDKNYDKFRRYDNFLCSWWRQTEDIHRDSPPTVVFVCQDASQREQFLSAADRELTGHLAGRRSHERAQYAGREYTVFAVEHDAHARSLEIWQLPAFPPRHPHRKPDVRRLDLVSAAVRDRRIPE